MAYKELSKHDKVKMHLQRGKSITGIEALSKFGVYRLSSIINRLRETLEIKMERTGKEGYAKYHLVK